MYRIIKYDFQSVLLTVLLFFIFSSFVFVVQWSSIFPPEQISQTQSALFIKKLLAVAVSNIMYLRTIFPEHAFGDRCLEGKWRDLSG